MVDKPLPTELPSAGIEPGQSPAQPSRAGGMRGPDARDAVAELAERAQIISQEAGSKVAAAMKDIIGAAAGITGFAIESARDLVQFMVRRGQMTQDEADKLIRQAEEAHDRRPASEKARPTATKVAADRAAAAKLEAARAASVAQAAPFHGPVSAAPQRESNSRLGTTVPRTTTATTPAAKAAAPRLKATTAPKPAKPASPAKTSASSKSAKASKPPSKAARTAASSARTSAKSSAKAATKSGPKKKSAGSRKR